MCLPCSIWKFACRGLELPCPCFNGSQSMAQERLAALTEQSISKSFHHPSTLLIAASESSSWPPACSFNHLTCHTPNYVAEGLCFTNPNCKHSYRHKARYRCAYAASYRRSHGTEVLPRFSSNSQAHGTHVAFRATSTTPNGALHCANLPAGCLRTQPNGRPTPPKSNILANRSTFGLLSFPAK